MGKVDVRFFLLDLKNLSKVSFLFDNDSRLLHPLLGDVFAKLSVMRVGSM